MHDTILYSILFLGHQTAQLDLLNKSYGVFFAYNKGAKMENSESHLIFANMFKRRTFGDVV